MNHAKTYPARADCERSKAVLSGERTPQFHAPCGGWHAVRPPAAPAPRKVPRNTGPSAAVRALVLARDGYSCVCCGVSVFGRRYSLQHRQRRSQLGGSSAANLITVLGDGASGCHERIDSRRDPMDEAKGYTVRSGLDPRLVGVMYFEPTGSGITVWLCDDGSVLYEPPAGAEAS